MYVYWMRVDLVRARAFIIFPQTDMIYRIDKRDDLAVKYVAFLFAAFISSFRIEMEDLW